MKGASFKMSDQSAVRGWPTAHNSLSRQLILAVMGLLLAWLTTACSSPDPIPVQPARDQPTFVWIFKDP